MKYQLFLIFSCDSWNLYIAKTRLSSVNMGRGKLLFVYVQNSLFKEAGVEILLIKKRLRELFGSKTEENYLQFFKNRPLPFLFTIILS